MAAAAGAYGDVDLGGTGALVAHVIEIQRAGLLPIPNNMRVHSCASRRRLDGQGAKLSTD
jgi:hypothetical protein